MIMRQFLLSAPLVMMTLGAQAQSLQTQTQPSQADSALAASARTSADLPDRMVPISPPSRSVPSPGRRMVAPPSTSAAVPASIPPMTASAGSAASLPTTNLAQIPQPYVPGPPPPGGYAQAMPGSSPIVGTASPPAMIGAPALAPLPGVTQQLDPSAMTVPTASLEDLAHQLAMQTLLPMSDRHIQEFKARADQTQRRVSEPVTVPNPVSRSIVLSLKPGERPPTLRLFPGNATTLTFADVTGAPWPVVSVTVGNPTAYQAQEAGEKGKTNMVVISPLAGHAVANNLVVTLINSPVPIIFQLETGRDTVDYRLDVSLSVRGPNAVYDIINQSSLAPVNDATVQSLLDGTPPRGARKVKTSSRDVEAWRLNDLVYVSTALEVMSPNYVGRALRNVGGTSLYTLVDTPVLIVSQDGRMTQVTVER